MKKLTVFYEGPYWVGVFEELEDEKLRTARIIFGPEPKDYEIYEWILKNYYNLRLSSPLHLEEKETRKINPKRLQRKINRELSKRGVSTKAQEAISKQREEQKQERKSISKERRDMEKEEKYKKKQIKKKQKKRGH